MSALWDWLQRFLFAPVPARSVGRMRVALGMVMVTGHLLMWRELDQLFGPDSPLTQGLHVGRYGWLEPYRLVTDLGQLHLLHGLLLVPLVCFTVGLGGRVMGAVSLWVLLSWVHSNPLMTSAGDRLLRLWALYMLAVPCTRAVSVDAWLARRRGRVSPATVPILTHRLVQLQLAWMYLSTGIAKMQGSLWHEGQGLYHVLLAQHFQRIGGWPTPDLLGAGLPYVLTQLGTYTTVVWELGFPVFLLWKPTRRLALGMGVLFHLGIGATLLVGIFSLVSLWGYLAFVPTGAPAQPRGRPAAVAAGAT